MIWLTGYLVILIALLLYSVFRQRKTISALNEFVLEQNKMIEKLQEQAAIDPLTGLLNRRAFERTLGRLLKLLSSDDSNKRHPSLDALAVFFVDLDHFKRINDTYGHIVGDEVLRKVAAVMQRTLRESDLVCRWGGEELVVALPSVYLPEALEVAEKVRKAIANTEFSVSGLRVTASLGVTATKQRMQQTELIERADQAVYEAKNTGRNRVVANYH